MSWSPPTYRQRREVLLAALHLARRDPAGPIPFEQVPGATEVFAGRGELLLALQHRWTLLLTARLELAMLDADTGGDRVDAVANAWRELAGDEPVLRRVLDAHLDDAEPEHARAVEYEHRMLALWSGLAEPTEPAGEVARIGRAFAGLLRSPRAGRRRGVAAGLLA